MFTPVYKVLATTSDDDGVDMFEMFPEKVRLFPTRTSFEDEPLLGLFLLWFVFPEFLEVFVALEVTFSVTWQSFASLVSVADESKKIMLNLQYLENKPHQP